MKHTTIIHTVVTAAALLTTAALLTAGPLNPPAGPIASTGKTLTEVEPRIAINATNTPGDANSLFKISQPGSYYLTGNITGVAGSHGIEIAASGVTVDLNGFELIGPIAGGAFDGINVIGTAIKDTIILNGTIRNWGDDAIDTASFGAAGGRIERICATANAGDGFRINENMVIAHCVAVANGNSGIFANDRCAILDCIASENSSNGIRVTSDSLIRGCNTSDNGAAGIRAEVACHILDNLSALNGTDGIFVLSDCIIRSNLCDGNGTGGTGAGITVTNTDNIIDRNHCIDNVRGINVEAAGNLIIANTCASNATNYVIVANNRYGPIINITANGAAAVNGSAAASSLTTTDPLSNFAY